MTPPKATTASPSDNAIKPEIYLFEGALLRTVDEIEALLAERDPQVCQHNGAVYVKLSGGPVRATATLLRVRAMNIAAFCRVAGPPHFGCELADPPFKYFEALLRKREWNFPLRSQVLSGRIGEATEKPVFRDVCGLLRS
jgi:hypothetical protein